MGITALVANNTVPSVSVRAEIITEEEKDILKIEIPKSRTVVSTRSGKMLKRRLKANGTPEVIPMFLYEIVARLSELALPDYSETTSTNVRLFIQRAKADDAFTKFIADEKKQVLWGKIY